ncbi:MAG: L,D-transpeptidase family protein [Clostridiales bacterium]|nr:L,D-transpeptidase family protein [Clostridiales bacterium]
MMKEIKRLCNLRLFVLMISLLVLLLTTGAPKALAKKQEDKYPYLIKVNRVHNTITIYEKDEDGQYKLPVKAMVCSVGLKGTETPKGTFRTQAKYRWKALMGDVWGQYSTRIVGGVLFHSVYYYEYKNPATLATKQYNKLGSAASHGCIRLTVEDAKWIYDNCPVGTTVVIYDDKESPGPLGKPKARKLASGIRWDPTDPNKDNPYYKDNTYDEDVKEPALIGVRYRSIFWGKEIDLMKDVKATSSSGTDITSDIVIKGEVNPYMAGEYEITYSVTDSLEKKVEKTIKVKVKESLEKPKFIGVTDRFVGRDTIIDRDFALSGVEAYCSGVRLDKKDIEVTIEPISDKEYRITYYIAVGQQVSSTEHSSVYVDWEVPEAPGVSEIVIPPSESLSK